MINNRFKHIRTGILHFRGGLLGIEKCNKHGKVWNEGESDPNKCCMECIKNSHRDRRYKT
jgi:hypothetical protein